MVLVPSVASPQGRNIISVVVVAPSLTSLGATRGVLLLLPFWWLLWLCLGICETGCGCCHGCFTDLFELGVFVIGLHLFSLLILHADAADDDVDDDDDDGGGDEMQNQDLD